VVVLAGLLTVGVAVPIELCHRAQIIESIGRAPRDWGTPDARAFSVASSMGLLRPSRTDAWWARVVNAPRPDPYLAAEAWHSLSRSSARRGRPAEALRQARRAAATAPDDARGLGVYYRDLTESLARAGREREIAAVVREGLRRASTSEAQRDAFVGAWLGLADREARAEGQSDRSIVAEELAKLAYASALSRAGRSEAARALFAELAQTADSERIRLTARARLSAPAQELRRHGH
jgi:hypothetical protein